MLTNSVVIGIGPDTRIENKHECILCYNENTSVKPVRCKEQVNGVLCRQVWLLCDICQVRNFNIRNTNCLICTKSREIDNIIQPYGEQLDIENNTEVITWIINSRLYRNITGKSCICLIRFSILLFFVFFILMII